MDGMVAVVRGVGDAGLTVTLVDGDRHYTLMPTTGVGCTSPQRCRQERVGGRSYRDSCSQATDGQYATIYQLSHCSVSPTSPHDLLTEYPPQRESVTPGDDNFVVGGYVQGERNCPVRNRGSQRECSSQGGSFARSLRRQPSPELTPETLERLVTYTHDKHDKLNRSPTRRPQSCRNYSRTNSFVENKVKSRVEVPTRDRTGDNVTTYNIRRVDNIQQHVVPKYSTVTSETQASVQTVSREVSTTPRLEPYKKNVAIPVSPKSSHVHKELPHNPTTVELSQNVTKQLKKTPTNTREVKHKILCRRWKSQGDVTVNRNVYEEILNFLVEIVSYSKFAEKLFCETKKDILKVKLDKRDVFHEYIDRLKILGTNTYLNNSSFSLDNLHNLEKTNNCFKKFGTINKEEVQVKPLVDLLNLKDNSTKRRAIRFFNYLLENPKVDGNIVLENEATRLLKQVNNLFDVPTDTKANVQKDAKSDFIKKSLVKFFKEQRLCVKNSNLDEITKKVINICNNRDKNVDTITTIGKEIMSLMEGNDFDNQTVKYTDLLLKHICSNVFEKPQIFPRNYLVFHNTQNSVQQFNDTANSSILPINQRDININLKFYTNQLVQIIEQWLAGFIGSDQSEIFRQVAINDLADDIVDRYKYLEMNPSKRKSEEDELEYLKFQIFKWIHELIGDDRISEALDHADVLLQKIRGTPVPMLTFPQDPVFGNTSLPPCCSSSQKPTQFSAGISTPNNTRAFSFSGNPAPSYPPTSPPQNTSNGKYRRQSGPVTFAPNPMIHSVGSVGQMPNYGQTRRGGSLDYVQNNPYNMRRMSGPSNYASGAFAQNSPPNYNQMGSNPNGIVNNLMGKMPAGNYSAPTDTYNVNQMPNVGQRRSLQPPTQRLMPGRRRMSGPPAFASGPMNITQPPYNEMTNTTQGFLNSTSSNMNPCCFRNNASNEAPTQSLTQIEDEFEQFVKNWVKQIPITNLELPIADKARLGICKGILIAVTKLKLEPTKFNDPIYCQHFLEDEIDELLDCLPKTEELTKAIPALKPQILEKTNNMITQAAKNYCSYKQQLVQSITNHMPRIASDMQVEESDRFFEDILKTGIAENYILFIRYNEEDQFKANIFKKKVVSSIDELIEHIKRFYGTALYNIDADAIKNEILSALTKVPHPSDDVIKSEVDEVLLGIDIEHWFSDLPLMKTENQDYDVILQRRHRDMLTKKIHDLEKQANVTQGSLDPQIKQEVMTFLQKLPLRVESTELNFMADELLNRLRNRNKDTAIQTKSIAFESPQDYDYFAQNAQHYSSYAERPQDEESSYLIVGGFRQEGPMQPQGNIPYVPQQTPYVAQQQVPYVTPKQQQAAILPQQQQNPYIYGTEGDDSMKYYTLYSDSGMPDIQAYQSPRAVNQNPSCCQPMENSRQQQSQQSQVQPTAQPPNQMPLSQNQSMNASQPSAIYQQSPQRVQQVNNNQQQQPYQQTPQQQSPVYQQTPQQMLNQQQSLGMYQQTPQQINQQQEQQPPCCQNLQHKMYLAVPFDENAQLGNVTRMPPNYIASTPQRRGSVVTVQKPFSGSTSLPMSTTPGFHSSQIAGPSDQGINSTQRRPVRMKPRQLATPDAASRHVETEVPLDPRLYQEVDNQPGYITPQVGVLPDMPPRLRRPGPPDPPGASDRPGVPNVRRKLDMEDTDDDEQDYRCRCLQRVFTRNKRSVCYDMEEFPFDRCLPVRFYPCFY